VEHRVLSLLSLHHTRKKLLHNNFF
jgi:hypothetical protein